MVLTRNDEPKTARTSKYTSAVLEEVRTKIKASDRVLVEARSRRDIIKETAAHFPGATRTFSSGSIAHGTVNHPVDDADCGVVLLHHAYPEFGPDGAGIRPDELVESMREFIRYAVAAE